MRTFDELEALWAATPPPPREAGSVRLLTVRREAGVHETPEAVEITVERGLDGDRWAYNWQERDPDRDAQVTLMNATVTELVAAGRQPLHEAGDNILVDFDISADHLPAGTRLRVGEATLEISAVPHTGCSKFSKRYGQEAREFTNNERGKAIHLRGRYAWTVVGGTIAVGDAVRKVPAE